MVRLFRLVAGVSSIGLLGLLASCTQTRPVAVTTEVAELTPYEQFVARSKNYPTVMEVYLDDELLKEAYGKGTIYICLGQQRGRLYVDGKVAADWPVSTGADTHPTPTGRYRVRLMKKEHASNRYGKFFDAEGKCVDNNADVFTQTVPEGGRFEGSAMPNWMRLTYDGVGMHTGKVKAGKRLSHGCIRLPHKVACMLFDEVVKIGTPVIIMEDIEQGYPVAEIMARREIAAAEDLYEASVAAAADAE